MKYRMLTRADAPGVAELFRSVYGEEYAFPTYYDPDALWGENQACRILSAVALTEEDVVVGHLAGFRSAPFDGFYEGGAAVVHADHRSGGVLEHMEVCLVQSVEFMSSAQEFATDAATHHPYSQKAAVRFGYRESALRVSNMPRSQESGWKRESLICMSSPVKERPCKWHLPAEYAARLTVRRPNRTVVSQSRKPEGLSQVDLQFFEAAQVARVNISQVGEDFSDRFDAVHRQCLDQRAEVIQVHLNLGCPGAPVALEHLQGRGYFLGGVLYRWFDDDALLLQAVKDDPDWESICAVSEEAQALLKTVREEWENRNPTEWGT